jgi:hypothetical protein
VPSADLTYTAVSTATSMNQGPIMIVASPRLKELLKRTGVISVITSFFEMPRQTVKGRMKENQPRQN